MKKVLVLMVGMMLIPGLAFGMQALTIDEMAEITGQSGVAIAMDDVKVFFAADNEETWWRTEGDFTAANTKVYDYDASIGLVRNQIGQMLYLNAVMAEDGPKGAAGYLYSPGRPLMYKGIDLADLDDSDMNYRDLVVRYGFNFGNAKVPDMEAYTGAVSNAFNASVEYAATRGITTTYQDYVEYKLNKNVTGDEPTEFWYDGTFDSKALTIRVTDKLEIFSQAATHRLDSLRSGEAVVGKSYDEWSVLDQEYAAYNAATHAAKIAGVAIGLPTVEIHYKNPAGETLEILIHASSTDQNPLNRYGKSDTVLWTDDECQDTWSFGVIYYGGERSTETIMVLDGALEITPLEAYARPLIYLE
jgi:hypothetical protein